jgi:hypothetical protein
MSYISYAFVKSGIAPAPWLLTVSFAIGLVAVVVLATS